VGLFVDDDDLIGRVRSGGSPPPPVTTARIWDRVPPLVGNAGLFSFGLRWSATIDVTAIGTWWWQDAGGPASVTARLWDNAGGVVLASGVAAPAALGWNLIAYAVPYAASAGVSYVAAATADNNHGYNNPSVLPRVSPDTFVTIPAGGGLFAGGDVFPGANSWDGLHGVDLQYSY